MSASFQSVPSIDPLLSDRTAARARVEGHVATLRRFTELALRQAERLDRMAEAREWWRDEAERQALLSLDDEKKSAREVAAEMSAEGEVAQALHRLARLVRLNIALEESLIDGSLNPERAAHSHKDRRRPPLQAVETAAPTEAAEAPPETPSPERQTGDAGDRERHDELLQELRDGLDTGLSADRIFAGLVQGDRLPDRHARLLDLLGAQVAGTDPNGAQPVDPVGDVPQPSHDIDLARAIELAAALVRAGISADTMGDQAAAPLWAPPPGGPHQATGIGPP